MILAASDTGTVIDLPASLADTPEGTPIEFVASESGIIDGAMGGTGALSSTAVALVGRIAVKVCI